MKKWMNLGWILVFAASAAFAEVVEFSEDELATESVMPVFDRSEIVRNRSIPMTKRLEAGLDVGWALTEAIYGAYNLGANITYHLNEERGINLHYTSYLPGVSTYADQLYGQYGLDYSRAPAPKSSYFLNYELKMYYGKMSFSKETVLNLSLYSLLGAGMVNYAHKSYPSINIGLGQRFYFTKKFALRFDMKLQYNNATVPVLNHTSARSLLKNYPVPSADDFSERYQLFTFLDGGFVWLF